MAVTSGFYNSLNGDRKYDAIQMSSIFDGIIKDGIFMNYLDRFIVKQNDPENFQVLVSTGRGWFDHSWILNDAILPIRLDQPEVLQDRIDAIFIDVNGELGVRASTIILVKGTPAINPVPPEPIKTSAHNQYPLAYIRVRVGSQGIRAADIEIKVGSGDTPYVTGPLKTINAEDMLRQWEDEWHLFYEEQTQDMSTTASNWRRQWDTWYTETTTDALNDQDQWQNDRQNKFDTWFASLQDELEPDVAATLAASIVELRERVGILEDDMGLLRTGGRIRSNMLDNNQQSIMDNFGNVIYGIAKFVVEEIV